MKFYFMKELREEVSITCPEAALQKGVLCFRPLVFTYFTGITLILSSGTMHFQGICGSSLPHEAISTGTT